MEGESGLVVPQLDERGLLPPGLHTVTMGQVEEMFGQFKRTSRRPELFKKLQQFLSEVKDAGFATEVRIDGSFVMGTIEEPRDIDVVLVMKPGWDLGNEEIRPFEYNLLSNKRTKKVYGIDVFSVLGENADDPDEMSAYFAQVNPEWVKHYNWPAGLKKGILRVAV
ncbi:MAG: hypothetical protein AABZ53_08280 [Planctomycetota bacterium]